MKRANALALLLLMPCAAVAAPRAIPGMQNVPIKTVEMAKKEAAAQKASNAAAAKRSEQTRLVSDQPAGSEPLWTPPPVQPRADQN